MSPVPDLRGAHVAITGASGAVGGAVRELLETYGCRVEIVGRRADATARWDMREPLPDETAQVLRSVDLVVHCAADVRLGDDEESARRINADSVGELVTALCDTAAPPRLVHVSTAFVESGGGTYHNPYERSKHQAEQVVRDSGLHGAIVRPSLVIGRTSDGSIPRFSGLYTVVRLVALGMVPAVPAEQHTVIDVIPVDAVADVIVDAVRQALAPGYQGMPVHTVASGPAAPSVQSLFHTVTDAFSERLGEPFPRPTFVSPDAYQRLFRPLLLPELSGGQRLLIDALEVFFPYFTANHSFDSVVELSREQVAETWRRSVRYWLDRTDHRLVVRSAAWSPRRAG